MEQPDSQVRTNKKTHCIAFNTKQNTATGLTTGITCVTPSPLSTTIPVRVRSLTDLEAHDAAKARTACTAIYSPGTLNDSNIISGTQEVYLAELYDQIHKHLDTFDVHRAVHRNVFL
jgi:hypothetical protein